jgi:hypothetical protein
MLPSEPPGTSVNSATFEKALRMFPKADGTIEMPRNRARSLRRRMDETTDQD